MFWALKILIFYFLDYKSIKKLIFYTIKILIIIFYTRVSCWSTEEEVT
ncbi:hypothetical protein AAJ76_3000036991 [Vairimorpha ceranae]|uniref:Uncharacterized protein n=1 Tax=Vairimorpha ceranae TaxID=40302 RepID=A0A0F9YRI0_9MICR|nr:hypothetical protein AAJ76_3000036991 [Vairimorpha ceranae]KKO75162.1 hypothetical protein AAJ76_3000036991 [Vairimorpha ceranae]